jgi:hypothetical protein
MLLGFLSPALLLQSLRKRHKILKSVSKEHVFESSRILRKSGFLQAARCNRSIESLPMVQREANRRVQHFNVSRIVEARGEMSEK